MLLRRKWSRLSLTICTLLLLSGCGILVKRDLKQEISSNILFNELSGRWNVYAISTDKKIIYLDDYKELEQLYRTEFLKIKEDGRFVYVRKIFGSSGECSVIADNTLLLKETKNFRYTMNDDCEMQTEYIDAECKVYSVKIDDLFGKTVLLLTEIEKGTGKKIEGKDTFIFEKDE